MSKEIPFELTDGVCCPECGAKMAPHSHSSSEDDTYWCTECGFNEPADPEDGTNSQAILNTSDHIADSSKSVQENAKDALDCALSGQSQRDRLIDSVSAILCGQAYDLMLSHTVSGKWPESEQATKAEHDMLLEMVGHLKALKALPKENIGTIGYVEQSASKHAHELTQVAKSKIKQMGGTVCGVLVRNEAGALAAVSDLGRVTWLDDSAELPASGEVAPVGFITSSGLNNLAAGHPAKVYPADAMPSPFEPHLSVYTHPPASQVPGWMTEISSNLGTQNNRITQDPMFVVFQKKEVVVDEQYDHTRIAWIGEEGQEPDAETEDRLDEMRDNLDGEYFMDDEITLGDEEWRRLALLEIDEFVTACFTEAGAKAYLESNGHNLRRPFIYVTSLYRNEEMKRLREWLLTTTTETPGDDLVEPDLMWDADNPEDTCQESGYELADYLASDMPADETMVVHVMCAKLLPSRQMKIWIDENDDLQWEWKRPTPPVTEGE